MQATKLGIVTERSCNCPANKISCITAKDWVKGQVTIQRFFYEGRDVRDKDIHPAVFPIALPAHFIRLLTHAGELVVDPFAGIGTTLLAAKDLGRNAVGFDLKQEYVDFANGRLLQSTLTGDTKQIEICDDALNVSNYLEPNTIALCITSPPYANMLNRKRLNKSMRGNLRENKHFLKVQQYSTNPRDLGIMSHDDFGNALTEIYRGILPLMKSKGHAIINVNDVWENNHRNVTHARVIEAIEEAGFEFRNTFIWDKRDLVNRVGIFGWPNNFISLGTTMEFMLDFWKPA